MDLSKNPSDQIKKPKFGDMELAKQLKDQWANWRKATKNVREIFMKLTHHEKIAKEDILDAFNGAFGEETPEKIIHVCRERLPSMTDRFTQDIILEGVRRYKDRRLNPDFTNVDKDGFLPWET